ncbi:DUF6438 domain-containing protein [Salinicola acroporae]|uniref:DUF6438 domain-containing protein n=1 Tax=Salinicola acroporae TaxID=1541440 RepID=A0ABT6I2E0_9GAMM|nr:DUF6438 domain-containing protein [Salinicola acroporae]MDH4571818.1 hypothetical protein [Salinicola acroporae]
MRWKIHYLAAVLGVLTVGGCAQQDVAASLESAITAIRYQVGPCHGTCPVYRVDLQQDGATRFIGERFTAVEGERMKTSDPERFALVKQRLSAWQPAMGTALETAETPRCGPRATDLSHYTVTWIRRDGETAVLEHDSGCRSDDARQLTAVLQSLPETLQIEDWVQP